MISLSMINKNSLIMERKEDAVVGKAKYNMWYSYNDDSISNIPRFSELSNVLKDGAPYRYEHTEYMLQSLYLLMGVEGKSEKECYEMFVAGRGNNDEQYMTPEQFTTLSELAKDALSTSQDFRFFEHIVATHDIGCIYGESRHFIKSGEMSVDIFPSLGYSKDFTELARVVNGNHSLFGDVLLGEGTPSFAIDVYNKLETISNHLDKDSDYAWKLLYLLNVLDIHGAYIGYMTDEKLEDMNLMKDIESLEKLDHDWIAMRAKLFDISDDSQFVPAFKDVYLQYVFNRTKAMPEKEAIEMHNKLALFNEKLKKELPDQYSFITFKSGKDHNLSVMSMFVDNEPNIEYSKVEQLSESEDGTTALYKGTFSGFSFTITNDGYLEIDDTVF